MLQGFEHLGWPASITTKLGILEILCATLYLIPQISVLGAIILTGYLGGAIATHVRIGEPIYLHVVIGIFIWLGLYLREPRLDNLLPIRTKDFVYDRSILINRKAEDVFAYIRLLKNFQNWNPFLKADPNATFSTRGTDGKSGHVTRWDGNKQMGSGEQEITRVREDEKRIEFELRFEKPFPATNTGYFQAKPDGNQTRVHWAMGGKSSFPMSLLVCSSIVTR